MDHEAWEELSVSLWPSQRQGVGLPASRLRKHMARPLRKGLRACSFVVRGEG